MKLTQVLVSFNGHMLAVFVPMKDNKPDMRAVNAMVRNLSR